MTEPGFWWKNRWGLLALLPVTALLAIVSLYRTDFYDQYLGGQPRAGVSAAPPEWVAYSGARLRLIALTSTADIYDASGKTVKLPTGVVAWKAAIEIQVDDQRKLTECEISLEDSAGRLFGTQPDELATARTPTPTCTAEDQALNSYQVLVFFVAPATAKPVAVRVVRGPALPGYARLVAA